MKSPEQLPAGWANSTLGGIGEWQGGGTPSKDRSEFWGGASNIPWVSPKDMKKFRLADTEDHVTPAALEVTHIKLVSAGTILVVVRSGILQRTLPVAIADAPVTLNQDLKGITPRTGIDSAFLAYYLRSVEMEILRQCAKNGTTVASIDSEALKGFSIPLAPSREQRRIVAAIEEQFTRLDAGVAALKRAQARLKRYRAAVLKAAVDGKLTEDWRAANPPTETAPQLLKRILAERQARWEADLRTKGKDPSNVGYEEPKGPDASGLPELPGGWAWATVGQLSYIKGGIQKQPSRSPRTNAYPYLRVANVLRGRLDLTAIEKMELVGNELEELRLVRGDILIVEGNGSKGEIGRSAIWNGQVEDCVHQNHIIRVRLLGGSSRFVDFYWNSPDGSRRVGHVAASTSGLYTLSTGKIAILPIPLPPPEEQYQIVAEVERLVSIVTQLEGVVDSNLKRAERLRQSILREAFAGRLVPQDPTDEPASVLLERIRMERSIIPSPSFSLKRNGSRKRRAEEIVGVASGTYAQSVEQYAKAAEAAGAYSASRSAVEAHQLPLLLDGATSP
jgi:type I restriction enzyme S subunit